MGTGGPVPTPQPISQYVVKVHSRCDLACKHCYVYEHVDQSWRGRPKAIAPETVSVVAGRIATHAAAHRLPSVRVVLHGGEPLLLGAEGLGEVAGRLRDAIDPITRLDLRMQSNGVLLSPAICDLLVRYDIRVGISLDGDQSANDRYRVFANGASSYDRVTRALALLNRPQYRGQYAGILCTIDVRNDPIAVYRALIEHRPPRVDLLLPHATWAHPPYRPAGERTPYAHWLTRFYDAWTADGRPVPVRLFDALRSTFGGGPSGSEWVGLDPADLVVVETDGTWEQVDSLKTAYDGAAFTGLSVFSHSVDEVAALPQIARRQRGLDDLCRTCRECPVVRQCGGGLYAHRYRPGSGFDNPSAYCDDLLEFIVSTNPRQAPPPADSPAASSGASAGLPAGLVERIGSGGYGPGEIEYLAAAQLAINRALLATVAASSETAQAALAVLAKLERDAPRAAQAVLAHPYVRVWAVAALRPQDRAPGVPAPEADQLGCLAAAAAIRAGAEVEVAVPTRNGALHLPTVGSVIFDPDAAGRADISVAPDGVSIRLATATARLAAGADGTHLAIDGATFWPTRTAALPGRPVALEDLDPYRDVHDWKAADRLSLESAQAWQETLAAAWQLIEIEAAHQLPALRAGLRALVPLVADPGGLLRSSTARHAFGCVAMALAAPDAVAVMLVHEFQHTVLGALLDLCDLFHADAGQRLRVGWRADPRPVEGVLQGTFAHLAVTQMWGARAGRPGADQEMVKHYRQYRDWTMAAIDTLDASGALTADGTRFVGAMAATVAGWPD